MTDDMQNIGRVVTVAITRDVIAGHSLPCTGCVNLSDSASPSEMRRRSLADTQVPAWAHDDG
jgi:hypothetical protein